MRKNNPFLVRNKLEIEVYTIGYKEQGESLVLFIKIDSKIVYSMVIDSFDYNGMNKTIDILEENNVNRINYLCWTHPDTDHSLGMDKIIESYVDKNTLINIPENIEINKNRCSAKILKIFNLLQEESKRRHQYRVYTISDFKDILAYGDDILVLYNEKKYNLKIQSIAPNSNLIGVDNLFNMDISKNKHSIALIFSFGDKKFLFSGDLENQTISEYTDNTIPSNLDFLKIPHHGSKSSDKLLDYIEHIDIKRYCL